MPAIGSYRGCDSCREWKKKCSSSQPGQTCSRCRTRNIPCVGAGQQRFKFKPNQSSAKRSRIPCSQQVSTRPVAASSPSLGSPKWPLRNPNSRVANALVYFLGSTRPGHSLHAFHLSLFETLPARLGYSVALDSALASFTNLLETQQLSYEQLSPRSQQLYISGLKVLQSSLADPRARYQPNTLCAAHIMSACCVWMVRDAHIARAHSEGLAYLMSILVYQRPKDPFLRRTCFAITSNLLQDSIFNRNILLNPWVQNLYDVLQLPPRPADDIYARSRFPHFELRVLAMIPDLLRHPRQNKERIHWVYNYTLDQYLLTKTFFSANKNKPSWNSFDGLTCNEPYGAYIAIGLMLNALLRVLSPSHVLLATEQSIFCTDAVDLAERAKLERPLAAHHIPQAIVSAWCVARDSKTKEKLRQLIEDYRTTYAMAKLVQHVSCWKAAPIKLREIPWFRLHCAKADTEGGSAINTGGTEIIDKEMYEACCIL